MSGESTVLVAACAGNPKMTKMTEMTEHATCPRHLLQKTSYQLSVVSSQATTHNHLKAKTAQTPKFNIPETGCATSHNQTRLATIAELKLQPKMHPENLWCRKRPQPQVKNKKIAKTNMKLQRQPTSKTPNPMHKPRQPTSNVNLPQQQNPKSSLKKTPTS
jgi:hypothetical protein